MTGASEIEWRRNRVVALTLEGLSAKEIADRLGTSDRTIVRDRGVRGVTPPQAECRGGRYNGGCRCDLCHQRHAELAKRRRHRRIERGAVPPKHGASGYRNYGCRCAVCCADHSAQCRAYQDRRKAGVAS